MKKNSLLFFVFLLLPAFFWGRDYTDFDVYQKKLSRESAIIKIDSYLKKDPLIEAYYEITADTLILYDSPRTQKDAKVEYVLHFGDQTVQAAESKKRSSLRGVKIAIDPGHFGGPYALLEERFIDIPENECRIQFDEGTLSFLTASYLKQLLEKEGAVVFLTRESIGTGAYEDSFFDWLKKKPEYWTNIPLNKIFRLYFNPLDLRARAEKINQFQPDLAVIIHYNSHHTEGAVSSNHCTTASNYNLVFIPGAFCGTELLEKDARYEFLRLVCTKDLESSLSLSKKLLDRFTEVLKVPLVNDTDGARYLSKCCIKVEEGIFARNLALTRLVHNPVCYGETLIQNNCTECQKLGKKDIMIDDIPCSSRIKDVATCYFEGIKAFLLNDF